MPAGYLPLIDSWVHDGYVVASPVFPLTSTLGLQHYGVDLGDMSLADAYENDLVNEPRDMSFALSELETLSTQSGSLLAHEIDPATAAAIGQSDGGDATLALVDNSCCVDSRFKAAVVLSGAEFPGFSGSYFGGSPVPLLVVQGTADTVNPQSLSDQIYAAAPSPKAYLTLLGADHLVAYTQSSTYEAVVAKVTGDFLNGYLRSDETALSNLGGDGSVAGTSSIALSLGG
jgi:predicted dienelactone hydrolase